MLSYYLSLFIFVCSADDADDIAVAVMPAHELNPNSTDEEKLLQSSALAYSLCTDFDLTDR